MRIVAGMTTRTIPRSSSIPPANFTDRLRAEWSARCHVPDLHRRLVAWGLDHVTVSTTDPLGDVLRAVGFDAPWDDTAADVRLARLVAAAAADELAARIVLQRILPGLVGIGMRRGRLGDGVAPCVDELVGTAWMVIRSYPIERRPHRVAANLLRDIEYQAFVRPTRLAHCEREVPREPDRLPDATDGGRTEPMFELVAALDEAVRRGLSDDDRRLLALAASTHRADDATEALGISDRTWRARKRAAAERAGALLRVIG